MRRIALAAVVALMLAPAADSQTVTVPPPPQPGPWRQLGAAAASRPGALMHIWRQLQNPRGLAIVAYSSSARPMTVAWSSYCEFQSDDGETEALNGTLTGVHFLSRQLSIMPNSTLCTVDVTARIPRSRSRVAAAVFGY